MTPEQQKAINDALARAASAPQDQGQGLTPAQQAAISRALGVSASSVTSTPAAPEPGALYQNLVGYGAIDTPGEYIGNAIGEVGRGIGRGIVGAVNLPSMAMNALERKVTGPLGSRMGEAMGTIDPQVGAAMREQMAQDPNYAAFPAGIQTPQMLEANPQSTPAEYAGTAGEFIGGGLLFGGGAGANAAARAGDMVRTSIVPGLTSEAAGQATEGTAIEPYARFLGGLLGAAGASAVGGPKSFGASGSSAEQAAMGNRLAAEGVRPTAGQVSGNQTLMAAEGRLQPTAAQIEDFTAATMRQIGSTSRVATPDALRATEQAIVKQMDDAVAGVTISPTAQNARAAADIAARYSIDAPGINLVPRIRGIATEITSAARGGNVSLDQLKAWRSAIGRLTVSPDVATRDAAHGLRGLIDDMTDAALIAAGRESDIASLATAREAYRNYIGVRDAASRAGAEAGLLSPTALNQSMIRAQGREAYATGRSTPMTEFTRAGAATLRPAPTVAAGGVRSIAGALPAGLATGGAAAGYALGNPLLALLGGVAGAAAPALGQSVMRSGPVQSLLANPALFGQNVSRSVPGILSSTSQQ